MPEFERENRYLVIKRKELHEAMVLVDKKHIEGFEAVCALVEMIRKGGSKPKPTLCCVVIESHWPEYETVWAMIKARFNKEKVEPDTKDSTFVLMAKNEDGNDVVPKKGDLFVRFDRGMDNLAFHGEITSIESNKIGVIGKGYINGNHYGKWWGDLLSLKNLKILNNQKK